jgi:misacylated tRNA(Ala) deacylase
MTGLPTEELFRADADAAYLRECTARVVALLPEGGVVLDRTVFYPLGGGQAGDAGQLLLDDGTAIDIGDARKLRETGQIVHLPRQNQEAALSKLKQGQPLVARLDWERRARHMRFHSATHLLCALVPAPVDGCSITAEYARLDFATVEPLDAAELTAGLARLVQGAHALRIHAVDEAELDAHPEWIKSLSAPPPRGQGRLRLVEVVGVDQQPCGGTHVRNTAEIGALAVTKVEKKSARTRRVTLGWA